MDQSTQQLDVSIDSIRRYTVLYPPITSNHTIVGNVNFTARINYSRQLNITVHYTNFRSRNYYISFPPLMHGKTLYWGWPVHRPKIEQIQYDKIIYSYKCGWFDPSQKHLKAQSQNVYNIFVSTVLEFVLITYLFGILKVLLEISVYVWKSVPRLHGLQMLGQVIGRAFVQFTDNIEKII